MTLHIYEYQNITITSNFPESLFKSFAWIALEDHSGDPEGIGMKFMEWWQSEVRSQELKNKQ